MAHVVGVQVGNARGDLRAGHAAVQVEHLGSDLLHYIRGTLDGHQLVVQGVAATDNLDLVKVVAVDCGKGDAGVVHLAGEHLIAEEPVAEDAAVAVGAEQTLSSGDVNKVAEELVHGVVLLLTVVKMFGVFVDLVAAEHSLKEEEGVEVWVLPVGSLVKDTDGGVVHLIISDHKQAWVENGFLLTVLGDVGGPGNASEVLFSQVHELLVVHGTSAHNDHVVTEVVGVLEVDNVVAVDLADVVHVTEDGLAHHVLSVNVIVDVLHQGFL